MIIAARAGVTADGRVEDANEEKSAVRGWLTARARVLMAWATFRRRWDSKSRIMAWVTTEGSYVGRGSLFITLANCT